MSTRLKTSPIRFALLGDLGGTHARFAIAEIGPGGVMLRDPMSIKAAGHQTAEHAAMAYMAAIGLRERISLAMIACAGPVTEDRVALTNLDWTLTATGLRARLGLDQAALINDLEAVAWAAPELADSDLHTIGPQIPGAPGGAIAVVGAGTGFNAASWRRVDGREVVLVGEGGHASFAAADPLEMEVVRRLTPRFGRVSVERLVSGPGMLNLYRTLCEIEAVTPACARPDQIPVLARTGDRLARSTVILFCGLLGAVAGDLALTLGARGGVLIGGGMAPGLLPELEAGEFRRRFEAKGRFQSHLAAIPTRVILHPHAALVGAGRALLAQVGEGV
ncbi:glucokinase [Phenylobacterium aquaticum]|nr:glucokinase [Phenylobacterium aquaticum]